MYIEIDEGLFIDSSTIEAIEATGQNKSIVYTSSKSYKVNLPAKVLVDLLTKNGGGSTGSMLHALLAGHQSNRG